MAINAKQLVKTMLEAASSELKEAWPEVKDFAESEAKKIAADIVMIEKLHLAGRISKKRARLHLQIQKNASKTVLLTIKGMGLIAVEDAINATVRAIREPVNAAIGFALI
jgi:hypothetical protein